MGADERFWDADIKNFKKGYSFDNENKEYFCLVCGQRYEEGVIYECDNKLLEAKKAIENHISKEHSSMFEVFLNMDKKYTGITEHQKNLLSYFYDGYSDKEIVDKLGGGSTSTIRNQRFTLKEKQKQAKVFLAIMELLEENKSKGKKVEGENLVPIHKGATMVDERYAITEAEREVTLKTYFENSNELRLKSFPSKEKKKIIVLQKIITRFDNSKRYGEKEINNVLKAIFDDYVTLRRYLIEYGFMERTQDCKEYWIKK